MKVRFSIRRLIVPIFIFLFLNFFSSNSLFAQINKGNWMVGGSANYSSSHQKSTPVLYYRYHHTEANGDAGYFIINKLAAGIRLSYMQSHNVTSYNDTTLFNSTTREIDFGPFIRYYILPGRLKYNFLVDGVYSLGRTRTKSDNDSKDKISIYAFSAGPVWFINSTAALELTVSYEHRKLFSYDKNSYMNVNLGFQIHLGKAGKKSK